MQNTKTIKVSELKEMLDSMDDNDTLFVNKTINEVSYVPEIKVSIPFKIVAE